VIFAPQIEGVTVNGKKDILKAGRKIVKLNGKELRYENSKK
jgi:hypothetical protein